MNELKCFVAMALGHEDTDRVYEDMIEPTLKNLKHGRVRPTRIDRIEFNDDIDDKIITELQESDFVIADLTYARPSVYFEAGYAQREVPVIYISRKDHLLPKANDEFGNYRVHFDLQMKNIISWSSPTDRNFSKKLKARIDKVIAPVLRRKKAEEQSSLESNQFAALSTNERLKLVSDICWSEISTCGYEELVADRPTRTSGYPHFDSFPICIDGTASRQMYERSQYYFGSRTKPIRAGIEYKGRALRSVVVHVTDSTTKRYLDDLYSLLRLPPIYNLSPPSGTGRISRLGDHIFVASLKPVPKTRVMESLTSFNYDEEMKRYRWKTTQHVPAKGIPGFSEIYVLPYGSEEMLLARNPGESFVDHFVKGSQIRTSYFGDYFGHKEKPVGRMYCVNRYINIYIIAPIQSTSSLRQQIRQIVRLNKL